MKKTRLISLLLSAVLAASSLPMMATSVAAADENLLDGISLTTANEADKKEVSVRSVGNKYLHVYNRAKDNGSQGIAFRTTGKMKVSVKYYVSFYARASAEVNKPLDMVMQLRSPSAQNNNPFFVPTADCEVAHGNCTDLYGTKKSNVYITLTSDWKKCAFEITLPNVDQEDVIISLYGYYNDSQANHPFDIDDFKIWTDAEAEEGYIKSETFDFNTSSHIQSKATQKGCVNESRVTNMKLTNGVDDYDTDLAHVSDEAFTRISHSAETGNTTASCATDITLEPGIYALSGDVRLGYYQYQRVDGETDLNAANVTVSYNSTSLGATPITTEWSSFEHQITIEETTTLSSVTFASDCNEQLDIKNVKLEYIGKASSSVGTEDATNLLAGTTLSANGVAISDGKTDDNGYLSITNRETGNKGIVYQTQGTIAANTEYTISFRARAAAGITDKVGLRLRANTSGSPFIVPNSDTTGEVSVGSKDDNSDTYIELTSDWNYFEYTFTTTAAKTNACFGIYGKASGYNESFEIDEFTITDGDDFNESYDFDETAPISTSEDTKFVGKFTTSNLANVSANEATVITHVGAVEEYSSVSASTAEGAKTTVTYTGAVDLAPATEYVVKGSLRLAEYSATPKKVSVYYTLSTASEATNYGTLIGEFTITDVWTEIPDSIKFNIPEGGSLSTLTFVLEDGSAIHFSGIALNEIAKPEDESTSLNGGILMVLLAKKKAAQAAAESGEQTTEPAEANGYLSITNRENGNKGIVYQTEGTIEAGKTYTISFRARAAAGITDKVGLRLRANTSGNPFILPNDNTTGLVNVGSDDVTTYIELTSQWKYFEYTFTTATAKKNANFGIYGKATGYNESFEIDDFTITDGANFNESYDFNETAPLGVYGQEPYAGKFYESNLANIHADEATIIAHVIEG